MYHYTMIVYTYAMIFMLLNEIINFKTIKNRIVCLLYYRYNWITVTYDYIIQYEK